MITPSPSFENAFTAIAMAYTTPGVLTNVPFLGSHEKFLTNQFFTTSK